LILCHNEPNAFPYLKLRLNFNRKTRPP
jgi:hypothetical protein